LHSTLVSFSFFLLTCIFIKSFGQRQAPSQPNPF
jgi:hypothetical protein